LLTLSLRLSDSAAARNSYSGGYADSERTGARLRKPSGPRRGYPKEGSLAAEATPVKTASAAEAAPSPPRRPPLRCADTADAPV
jgi:hypothetical protein